MRWLATVVRMDGRRIDLLELTKLGRHDPTNEEATDGWRHLRRAARPCCCSAANAFFVGAEFALISARRDRLEALAEQGKQQRGAP